MSRCVVPELAKLTRPRVNGSGRVDVTRDDLRAVGAQLEQFERAEGSWTVSSKTVAGSPAIERGYLQGDLCSDRHGLA